MITFPGTLNRRFKMLANPFDDPFQAHSGPSTPDIFRRPRAGGVSRPSKQETASEAEADPGTGALVPDDHGEQEEAPKKEGAAAEKVILRNPRWEVEAVGFNEETEISVEADLPDSQAHKTKVEFELFAETPDGPESISKGQGSIQSGRAVCKIPVYIPQFKDEFGNLLNKVKYFFTAKHSASDPLKDETVSKDIEEMADRLLECHILQDITFATGKSQVSPRHAPALKDMVASIKGWRQKHPDGKLAIFGHADAVGREDGNKALSERRAKAIFAFLVKDAETWAALYEEEKWGLAATQELLKHLGHDPGAIDGKEGPKTQAAVKAFQGKKGLSASGTADAATRSALYASFMEACNPKALSSKDFDTLDGKPFTGCSEFNLVEKIEGPSETNRRVAVVLLKSNRNFPIQYPCKHGDIAPCKKQVGRKGERRTAGFGCLFYDQLVKEVKTGGARNQDPEGTLKFVGVKEEEEVKQYVNLDPGQPSDGPERLIEVTAEGVPDGTTVYWTVIAPKENSLRSSPKPGIKPASNSTLSELKSGTAELETSVRDGKASCILVCGLAGGDRFMVSAALSKGKTGIWFQVENWRKLHYEIMAPDFMPFEQVAVPEGGTAIDFPTRMRERMKSRLDSVFVEYELFKSHLFDESMAPEGSIFKSEQLHLPPGKKAYVLTDHTFKAYPKNFDKGRAPRSIGLKLCNRNYFFVPGKSQLISRNWKVNSKANIYKVHEWEDAYFIPNSAADGKDAVKALTWKALVDPGKFPNHPAVHQGKARQGALDSSAIRFISISEFEVVLPSGTASDPGFFVGRDETSEKCPVEIKILFEAAEEGLGLAGDGSQAGENLVVYNSSAPESFVDVLLHELGHSMGQTVYADYYPPPKGFTIPKTTDEADPKYAFNGEKGHAYVDKEHSGSHCAYGLDDTEKSGLDYRSLGGTCIMYGENSGSGPSLATTGYCPQCCDYIKARDLRNLESIQE